jgi:selenocysteine lyase/cysteine desulfurase
MSKKKVVTSSLNFPTNVIMWQRMREAGLLRRVDVLKHEAGSIRIEEYEKAIDDDTALVSVDYVSWLSGSRENVREISELAHKHGALLAVDSFHALGVFPFDVKKDGIDILVSGFYKWLCGPHGVACVYIDENLLGTLLPSYLGWLGIHDSVTERVRAGRDPFDVPFPLDRAPPSDSASRFEWGTWASIAVKGAVEAMKFAVKADPAARFKAIVDLKKRVVEGLDELGVKTLTPSLDLNPGGGIVSFECENQTEVVARLAKRKVVVSGRFGHLRVSPHFYNSAGEIDRFLSEVQKVL